MNELYLDSGIIAPETAANNTACCEKQFKGVQHPELTRLERELLEYLAANCGRPVSRTEILSSVWRLNPRVTVTRTVDMHIAKLRHKLEHAQNRQGRLLTIRGQGYMLVKQGVSHSTLPMS